jgi:hypothetical protein
VSKKASPSYQSIYVLALILSLVMVVVGIYAVVESGAWAMLAAGCAGLLALLITWPAVAQLAAFHQASTSHSERLAESLKERFEEFSILLNLISEQQLLSDRAKGIAFREKDSDALRRAIQDEMIKQNWEAALSLANEMQESFGYRQEASRLRTEIEARHQEVVRKQVAEAVGIIDRHSRGEAWEEALIEAGRIAKLYPENAQAAALPREVEKRREAQKQQLIQSWNDALTRHDVDGGIEILKRLDAYLTPTEAEAYQESARSIFKEKIGILRTQFSTAVQEHRWAEALRLADTINTDFPNSQMAKEVREMMDTLRARAAGLEPAPV